MEFLNNVFLIGFFISILAFITGMIKPSWMLISSRKKVAIFTLSSIILSFILFGITQTEEQKAKIQADLKAKEKIELSEQKKLEAESIAKLKAEEKNQSLGLTVEQFREKFNNNVKKLNTQKHPWNPKQLPPLNVVNNDGENLFTLKIEDLEMAGEVTDSGYIKNVSILVDPQLSDADSLLKQFRMYFTITAGSLDSTDSDLIHPMDRLVKEFARTNNTVTEESKNLRFLMTGADLQHITVIISKR